tara:strand:- start:3575 stop:4387 length:813 start_codon:yes stop_codon:yes gene_type:complete
MDLYSADVGAIQQGNMRSQAVMDANNKVREHNNALAGQISQLKSQEKSADTEEGIKDAIGGFIASGKIGGKVKNYQKWVANQTASNPTTQAENQLSETANESPTAPPTKEDPSTKLTDEGDGIFSSEGALEGEEGGISRAKQGIKNALGVSDEAVENIGKGVGEIASVGLAGMDIYKDIKAGGIAGDNWASKTSNVLQIGGAIADLGGVVFPPLALLGGAVDIASGVSGEIGDLIDSGKQDKETDKLQQQETETTQTIQAPTPASTGRVS